MTNINRDIGSEDFKITELVKALKKDKFLIPTFQREFVWKPENILKLWDSIYRFYPIGSILYWETDSYLHTHRKLGGFKFPHDEDTVRKFKDWQYILDGQQRATTLLITMQGGKDKVEGDEEFDYTMYFDAVNEEFFFANQLEKRGGTVPKEFLIRLRDVPSWDFGFRKNIANVEGFNAEVEQNLEQLSRIFSDYKISVIRIEGVEVNEVCEIFERINQEGKKLDPVDIIVARTYRTENEEKGIPGFYLRDNLKKLREILSTQGSQFQNLEEYSILQMAAICLRKQEVDKRKSFGITPSSLSNLTTEILEINWDGCQKTILEAVKLLNDTGIYGPEMLPFIYLVFPICYYLHKNSAPKRSLVRQWFWRNAFGKEEFRKSTDVYEYCHEDFTELEKDGVFEIEPLTLSRSRLVQSSYYYRNPLSRAVLAFLASLKPIDFSDEKAVVLDNVYLLLSQAPNLHHIYPRKFLEDVEGIPADAPVDSLMNICFLRARTNIKIGARNPLEYFRDFEGITDFNGILNSHLIPGEFIERDEFTPYDYRDFLFKRADLIARKLKESLPDVEVRIVD